MSIRAGAILGLLSIVSCGPGHDASRAAQTRSSQPLDTHDVIVKSSVARDTVFDAFGIYIPDSTFTVSGYTLVWFTLQDSYNTIQFQLTSATDSVVETTCGSVIVTRDTLDLRCPESPVGEIVFQGHFLDSLGRFYERPDQFTLPPVLVATVRCNAGPPCGSMVQFRYWGGRD
jgi:hypothetical protein